MTQGELKANSDEVTNGRRRARDRNGFPIFESEIIRQLGSGITAFNELRVATRTNIFNLSSVYPLSLLNDVQTGTITHEQDEYKLAAGASLETAELGRYVSGYQVESGKGVRIVDSTQGAKWGYFNDNNGMWWRYDGTGADGLSVGITRGGTEIIDAARADWNIDRLDGKGPSGINLDNGFEGLIWQELIGWYGYLPLSWWVVDNRSGLLPQAWPVHISGQFNSTSMRNPNLPIRIDNEGASGDIYVGGRQFSIVGDFLPNERITSAIRSNEIALGTSWTPILSVKRKAGTSFEAYSFRSEAFFVTASGDGIGSLMLVLGATLTNGTFALAPENRSAGETSVLFDEAATSVSSGEGISGISPISAADSGPQGGRVAMQSVKHKQRIPRELVLSLVGKTVSGTGVNARGFFDIAEER